ncbi:MAG: cobalamin biosynthesis protein CobB [Dermatophilaceae bacterium]
MTATVSTGSGAPGFGIAAWPATYEPVGPSKGRVVLVHLYPREMSIYGDFGNTRVLQQRLVRHGYTCEVRAHAPGEVPPADAHLVFGGGGQDSGQARVEDDLARIAPTLRHLADDGVPMLMICGMYQLFGNAFITVGGQELPGLGILDVTTTGGATRMIGPIVLRTRYGDVVGYENHSGRSVLGAGQAALGEVLHGYGNNPTDRSEGAVTRHVHGTYLHGPVLPANTALADALIGAAVERALGRPFEPEPLDDTLADEARTRQIRRVLAQGRDAHPARKAAIAAVRRVRSARAKGEPSNRTQVTI